MHHVTLRCMMWLCEAIINANNTLLYQFPLCLSRTTTFTVRLFLELLQLQLLHLVCLASPLFTHRYHFLHSARLISTTIVSRQYPRSSTPFLPVGLVGPAAVETGVRAAWCVLPCVMTVVRWYGRTRLGTY